MKLTNAMRADILEHAQSQDPRECCGLIAIVKGRKKYFPCRNIADTPDEHFVLSGEDYAAIEDKGEIISIVHSHPATNPSPSAADRLACQKSGLPWFIINPKTEAWGYCEPDGFELPYVGREFVFGMVDCYTLCQDWYKKEMGLQLSDYQRRDKFWERGENLYLDNFYREGFRKISFDELQYGDALLMQLGSNLPNHAAIYIDDQQILHHIQRRLSSRDVLGGYYIKNTAMVLRHESR
jgi:proteasome lid subunit RPN8/RPN11